MKSENNKITCAVCKRDFNLGAEVEKGATAGWICGDCADKPISLDLLDFIHERIALTRTEDENHGRFVLRELVQNADDAKSSIIVLRFEEDSLLVANDGRAFTADEKGDFARISLILKRHQAEDKETTGHFGSGFQTVYALTNSPEVHSSGRSGTMNPVKKEWEYAKADNPSRLVSPYAWKREKNQTIGVIFRFPWRDNDRAEVRIGDTKPFHEANDWPRWNKRERKMMYDDLRDYLRHALLCCNHLRTIRLVWVSDQCEAYQAERDFALTEFSLQPGVVEVKEGKGKVTKKWYSYDERNNPENSREWKSFQTDDWIWQDDSQTYRYLLCSGHVKDIYGSKLYVGKASDGTVRITKKKDEIKELKKNEIRILFPLFDVQEDTTDGEKAFLYSTIPLPRRGGNRFVFTGHFFPEEGRKDVAVSSLDGKSGEWHQEIVKSVGRLYLDSFQTFVEQVRKTKEFEDVVRQRIILNSTPAIHLAEWMRPTKETSVIWASDIHNQIIHKLMQMLILWTGFDWVKPGDAYWPRRGDAIDVDGCEVLDIIGHPHVTKDFIQHPSVVFSFRNLLHSRELTDAILNRLFFEFMNINKNEEGSLVYGQKLVNGLRLQKRQIETLVSYFIERDSATSSTNSLPVVPGADGVLRSLSSYRIVPNRFAALRDIMPSSMRVHPDFEKSLSSIDSEERTLKVDGVITAVSRIAKEDPARFDRLSPEDHKSISRLLVEIVEHPDFSLRQTYASERFIPASYRGEILLLEPNSLVDEGVRILFKTTRTDEYARNFLYVPVTEPVIGLTAEVSEGIRFLNLVGIKESELKKVIEKLELRALQYEIATNFVRYFLADSSDTSEDSLFRDDVLAAFLGTDKRPVLDRVKKEFLKAIKSYYHHENLRIIQGLNVIGRSENRLRPSQMEDIPLLYDSAGKWDAPKSFAIEIGGEIEALLGYKTLHKDFEGWHRDTLKAIGVSVRPESERIIEVVGALMKHPGKNRQRISDIVALVLTSETPWNDRLMQLSVEPWIPTADESFRNSKDVVLPIPANHALVGEAFPRYFDVKSCSRDFQKRFAQVSADIQPQCAFAQRASELGIAVAPTLEMTVEYISQLAEEGTAPPDAIFEFASHSVTDERGKSEARGWYFSQGSWYEGKRVLLTADATLSHCLSREYLVVSPESVRNILPYLLYIGSKMSPTSKDLLEVLIQYSEDLHEGRAASPERLRRIWEHLADATDLCCSGIPQEDIKLIVYPVGDEFIPLGQIVIGKDRTSSILRLPGWYGKWYFLADGMDARIPLLERMGIKAEFELDAEEIKTVLESIVQEHRTDLNSGLADTVVRLIDRLSMLDDKTRLSDFALWPIRSAGVLRFSGLKGCYIRDLPEAKHFEDVLSFLWDTSDGEVRTNVRDRARSERVARSFSDGLDGDIRKEGERVDIDGTTRLHMMAEGLRVAFPELYDSRPASIDWLSDATMNIVESLMRELTLDGHRRHLPMRPCAIDPKDRSRLLRLGFHPTLHYDLTQMILSECLDMGILDSIDGASDDPTEGDLKRGRIEKDIERTIYYMLTESPLEWGDFIDDYDSSDGDLPPMIEEDNEFKPGLYDLGEKLKTMYGFCQICGRRTPYDVESGRTCERIKSIVSNRGGYYKGDFDRYELANSLYMCPIHHTLYERKLIRFPDLDDPGLEGVELSSALLQMADRLKAGDRPKIRVRVYESAKEDCELKWNNQSLLIEKEHAISMLKWLSDWVKMSRGG